MLLDCPYCSTRDSQLNLSLRRANQFRELLTDAFQKSQSVVIRKGVQEILDRVALVLASGMFLKLGNNRGFVCAGERRRHHDGGQLRILVIDIVE